MKEALDSKEISKSIVFFGIMNALKKIAPSLLQKEGINKMVAMTDKVPEGLIRNIGKIMAESMLLSGIGHSIDVAFEGRTNMSWEEYLKILILVGLLHKGP
jgi:hypothetical protein